MIRFKVAYVRTRAKDRPPGYVEDVLSRGTVEGGFVTFEDDVYDALVAKYRPPVLPPTPASSKWGPPLWEEMHRAGWAGRITPDFLADFARRIPSVACGCGGHWESVVAARRLPLGESPETQFAWTVEVHNAVNHRLGKPEMSVEAAREQWSS